MPKENRSSSRRGRRYCLEVNDDRSSPCIRNSVKTPPGSKRYSPFQRDSTRQDSRDSREFKELSQSAAASQRNSRDSKELRERRDSTDSKDSQIRDTKDFSESNTEKENMTLTLHKNNSIIGNGIKYIMFPLHLLHLCIFGTSTAAISAEKQEEPQSEQTQEEKKVETKKEDDKEKKEDKDERSSRKDRSQTPEAKSLPRKESPRDKESKKKSDRTDRRRSKSPSKEIKPRQRTVSEDDYSSDEMVTAPEDSDSASDHWFSANDSMLMNMSIEYDHGLEKSMSFALEEPMDVSMEEHFERLFPSTRSGKDERKSRKDEKRSATPRGFRGGRESSSRFRSVDEEIATIFQKQCTSSEDESPVVSRAAATRSDRGSKTPCRTENRDLSAGSRTKKTVCDNNNNSGGCSERKKKTSDDFEMNKRRKTSRENDASQKRSDHRNGEEIIDEKPRSREDTPSKRRSRSSRTPSKAKDASKRREVKEIGIQTDSAFSDEEDVEMTPLELKTTERWAQKSCRRLHTDSPQVEDMDQDLDYIADNEDSNDGYVTFVRKRISSGSTSSSSSTDLGFDERGSMTAEAAYRLSRWKLEPEDVFGNRMPITTRPPPGFPEQPQYPPLTSGVYRNSNYLSTQSLTASDKRYDHLLGSSVPRAPTPMRHLYYNYPEFMDRPENVGSSKILWNIIRNNYR